MSFKGTSRADVTPIRRIGLLAGLCLLLAASTANAQISAKLSVETTEPFVNQAIRMELVVSGTQNSTAPEFPKIPNCIIQPIGDSKAFKSVNGRTTQSITHNYSLSVSKTGEVTIPSIKFKVEGKALKTKPITLNVREVPTSPASSELSQPESSEKLFLADINCAEQQLYVGQKAKFTLTVWIKAAQFNGSLLSKNDMIRLVSGNIDPFDAKSIRTGEIPRPREDGTEEIFYIAEFEAEFVLQQAGPLTFDNVYVGIDYPTRVSVDRFWGRQQISRTQPIRISPNIAVPDVLPLPNENQPANFSGAVGRYRISAFAVPTNVRVGDPIKLVVDITGDPIETIPGPNLAAIPELLEDFRVPTEELAGTVNGNRKRFTQTIRAKHADVKNIPPIEFAYFNPAAGEYVVASSEPIPVLVSMVEQLDAADLTDFATDTPAKNGPQLEVRDGLRGNKTRELDLLATTPTVTNTQVLLATGIPPAAFFCLLGISLLTRSGRDTAALRRRGALRNAEHRIDTALHGKLASDEFHNEIVSAVANYLGDRLNQPPARFLGTPAVEYLQQLEVDQGLVDRLAELLQRCEQAAYAGDVTDDTSLADEARRCLSQLEGERI